jgi:hypothetical protein
MPKVTTGQKHLRIDIIYFKISLTEPKNQFCAHLDLVKVKTRRDRCKRYSCAKATQGKTHFLDFVRKKGQASQRTMLKATQGQK